MVLEIRMKLCVTEMDFLKKIFLPQILGQKKFFIIYRTFRVLHFTEFVQ